MLKTTNLNAIGYSHNVARSSRRDITWSKIWGYSFSMSRSIYFDMNQPYLKYHSYFHISTMYDWAKRFQMTYDINLDVAIMCHDWVYDDQKDKERRSADKFLDTYNDGLWTEVEVAIGQTINSDIVVDLIMSTKEHKYCSDRRLIILDLADLAIPYRATENAAAIKEESMLLYRIGESEYYDNSLGFFDNFVETITDMKAKTRRSIAVIGSETEHVFWGHILSAVTYNYAVADSYKHLHLGDCWE